MDMETIAGQSALETPLPDPTTVPAPTGEGPLAAAEAAAQGDPPGMGPVDGTQAQQMFGYITGDGAGIDTSAVAQAPQMDGTQRYQQSMRDRAIDDQTAESLAASQGALDVLTPAQRAMMPPAVLAKMRKQISTLGEMQDLGHGEMSTFNRTWRMGELRDLNRPKSG